MPRNRTPWIQQLCVWLLLAASGPGHGQELERGAGPYVIEPGSMPAWTVPVLRLVSATHVEPTTGVVISDTGLVLVPEDFAGSGDEIIVLDGGTDIIRNGRPARIEKKFTIEGLQVLSVKGLKRQGAALAASPLEDGEEVLLTAFPPAEQIAEGEPPLSVAASVQVFSESGKPGVSAETPLPNVTGALVNRCGDLVGVSLADDVQTMEPSPATRYQWGDTLLRILKEMQIVPRETDCPQDSGDHTEETQPPVEEAVAEEPAVEETPIPEEEPPEEPVTDEDTQAEPEEELPAGEPAVDILPPIEKGDAAAPGAGEESGAGGWWWLLAAAIVFGLGMVLHRLRKTGPASPGTAPDQSPLSVDPSFTALAEDPSATDPRLDSTLRIRGVLQDGTSFEDSCDISEHAINIVIGRSGADLVIDSPAVSRKHACLNGTARQLTLSDLGSSNGTSINGVPCLEGEIMYLEPGDTFTLGDARCSFEITTRHAAGSEEI